ncbi:MAG TPA: methyltransferase domain-containing protein [Chitinophagaceae bacterium]
MEKRRKFQGALNILSFNRHFYYAGIAILSMWITGYIFIGWAPLLFWIITIAFLYGLFVPLFVSAYVYDYSGYYSLNWLKNFVSETDNARLVVNIHAGFDETSFLIKDKFQSANLRVFDFYNAEKHTEPAIVRARKVSLTYPDTEIIMSNKIPLADNSADIIFLLSAVHEIRSNDEKVIFLKECHRVCKPTGKIIMTEHLRDFPNFLAFSVGFTHFFSRNTWKKAFSRAGFTQFNEKKFTPFMSIFQSSR